MKKISLSPSSLALLKECPRCFWLTHNTDWKRPRGIFPSLPSGIDEVLKKYFSKFENNLPPELRIKELSGFKLYPNNSKLKDWQNSWRGISWTDEKGNRLRGAIDYILVKEKKFLILDFKTKGSPPKEGFEKFYKDQLNLYNFLFRKNGYETYNFSILLFYAPKKINENGEFIFETSLKKMKVDVNSAENLFKTAVEFLNGKCPKKRCEWCRFVPHQEKIF